MDVYLSEKEQIQKIKDWWKKYGTTILVCVVIFLGASFGWRYWRHYQITRAQKASVLYEQMISADLSHKTDNFKLFAKHLMQDYKSTPYAGLAALILSRQDVDAKDLNAAENDLQWAINHASDKSLRQMARIRKARLLLAAKKPNVALQILGKVNDMAFNALISEVRGDSFLALGNKDKALQAYKIALNAKTKKGIDTAILAMKINFLTK